MKKKSAFHSVRPNLREGGFFKLRLLFGVLLFFAGVTIVLFALGKASAQPRTPAVQTNTPWNGFGATNKIAPWVMEHTANGQESEFFVVLADQADLSQAANFPSKAEKRRYVYDTLLNKAQTTQEPVLQWLRERSIEHQSFYIVNAILVKGNREIAEALATRPEVARVEGNPRIHNDLPQPGPIDKTPPFLQRPQTVEPGINYTDAPQVWALGFTGQNIVVASADTGNRWTHNALKPHYRGWDGVNANHSYNWHDSIHDSVSNPCGNDSPFPCDDFFHGSHTLGTAIGDDGMGNQIGMAPGAKWIGCRNMDQGNGTPARYMECMEFFLAPYPINCTPNDGDPTKAPDITINSWGCPASEGCSANTLRAAVEAQAAAGIMMVVAAGNSGSGCSTVSDPPSFYAASYTVGALNTGTDTIASFSSRGPVSADGSGRIKPDITAPGTGTRSASNAGDNAYTTASGTSMATPHISGAMALLWSALPGLRHQITASRDALNSHAVFISSTQCGTAGPPNNVYGWGRVDIAAAVGTPSPTSSPSPTPTATATATASGTPTATATATSTSRPTPTPRSGPTARPRPHRRRDRSIAWFGERDSFCSPRPSFCRTALLPAARSMTEQYYMSCSNTWRETLSCSHRAASPGRVAAWQKQLNVARRLQPLIWLGLSVLATMAHAETWELNTAEPLEKYDMPPAYIYRLETSPRMILPHGVFISYQVNVDANGNNIVGDAANEPSIAVDPTDSNKITNRQTMATAGRR